MIADKDFDHFLRKGYIEGLVPGTSLETLLNIFGHNHWYVKDIENNGLIYGIIKVGFIEFHIYDEKLNGISYRPDITFPKKDFKGVTIPRIIRQQYCRLYRLIGRPGYEIKSIVSGSRPDFGRYAF